MYRIDGSNAFRGIFEVLEEVGREGRVCGEGVCE
jgi:hypothetical protein